MVAQYDRRKLHPNNERLDDSYQQKQPTTQDADIPIYKRGIYFRGRIALVRCTSTLAFLLYLVGTFGVLRKSTCRQMVATLTSPVQ